MQSDFRLQTIYRQLDLINTGQISFYTCGNETWCGWSLATTLGLAVSPESGVHDKGNFQFLALGSNHSLGCMWVFVLSFPHITMPMCFLYVKFLVKLMDKRFKSVLFQDLRCLPCLGFADYFHRMISASACDTAAQPVPGLKVVDQCGQLIIHYLSLITRSLYSSALSFSRQERIKRPGGWAGG